MSSLLAGTAPALNESLRKSSICVRRDHNAPRRTAPFSEEPGYYEPAGLWLYGNVRLLHRPLGHVARACGQGDCLPKELDAIEREAEELVLGSTVLVCGVHSPAHQRSAVVPLRWGTPRVVVVSGGFCYHLGDDLTQEPFRAARLWRYRWDAATDLIVSRRAPDKLPTYALHNPTVDRMIAAISQRNWPGLCSPFDSLMPMLGPAA